MREVVGRCFRRFGAWRAALAPLSGGGLRSISIVRRALRVYRLEDKGSEGRRLRGGRSLRSEPTIDSGFDSCLCDWRKKAHVNMGLVGHPGGDEGIRTLDAGLCPHAPLAGECLRPLGHVS